MGSVRSGSPWTISVEWEDAGMDREDGAAEACSYVRRLDFRPSATAFDEAFRSDLARGGDD